MIAQELLKQGVKSIRGLLPPSVLMHTMDKVEGELTQVEERVFLEVAYGAGANKAAVWTGKQLGNEEVRRELG